MVTVQHSVLTRDERTRKLFENMFENLFLFANKNRTRTLKIFYIENKNRTRTKNIEVKNTVLRIGLTDPLTAIWTKMTVFSYFK